MRTGSVVKALLDHGTVVAWRAGVIVMVSLLLACTYVGPGSSNRQSSPVTEEEGKRAAESAAYWRKYLRIGDEREREREQEWDWEREWDR